jgi:uncharacterized SAM-binding protein YcdF (DUF218 family)
MFILSKAIGTVGQPPALVLIALLLLLKPSKPLVRRLLIPFILIFYFLSIRYGADLLLIPLESYEPPCEASRPELIVVPGGGSVTVKRGEEDASVLNSESRSRILEAVMLYRTTGLPVLFSGGSLGDGRSNEAEAAAELLLRSGLPSSMILTERRSRSTRENARYTAKTTERRDIILVTSAFHMKRAAGCFLNEGFRLHAAAKIAPLAEGGRPAFVDFLPSMSALSKSTLALHEYGGLIWYALTD